MDIRNVSPFELSFQEYLNLSYWDMVLLMDKVSHECREMINDAWRRGKRTIVICDGKIIYEDGLMKDPDNELLLALARRYDKAIYTFSAPDLTEEPHTWD